MLLVGCEHLSKGARSITQEADPHIANISIIHPPRDYSSSFGLQLGHYHWTHGYMVAGNALLSHSMSTSLPQHACHSSAAVFPFRMPASKHGCHVHLCWYCGYRIDTTCNYTHQYTSVLVMLLLQAPQVCLHGGKLIEWLSKGRQSLWRTLCNNYNVTGLRQVLHSVVQSFHDVNMTLQQRGIVE